MCSAIKDQRFGPCFSTKDLSFMSSASVHDRFDDDTLLPFAPTPPLAKPTRCLGLEAIFAAVWIAARDPIGMLCRMPPANASACLATGNRSSISLNMMLASSMSAKYGRRVPRVNRHVEVTLSRCNALGPKFSFRFHIFAADFSSGTTAHHCWHGSLVRCPVHFLSVQGCAEEKPLLSRQS